MQRHPTPSRILSGFALAGACLMLAACDPQAAERVRHVPWVPAATTRLPYGIEVPQVSTRDTPITPHETVGAALAE